MSFNLAHPGLQNRTEQSTHIGALFGHETCVRRFVDSPLSFVDQVIFSIDWLVITTISPPFKTLEVICVSPQLRKMRGLYIDCGVKRRQAVSIHKSLLVIAHLADILLLLLPSSLALLPLPCCHRS